MSDNNLWLPKEFLRNMQEMLGDDYEAFLSSYTDEYLRGVRCNTLKLTPEGFLDKAPFPVEKVAWTENGFYVNEDEQPAKHPFYFAGLYYIQEPSAMLPASLIPVKPFDKVLDLCAAPGGKSTELAAKLKGKGLLVSNDISVSRAKALLKNIELFGVKNAVVISEAPDKLSDRFEEYFDCILVDAPCSGEGMFRKAHSIAKNWEQYGSSYYADIQRTVLPSAVRMLKPGGFLLYSTCTFSVLEDEDSLEFVLKNFPEMELAQAIDFSDVRYKGFIKGLKGMDQAIRLFPHKIKGEGHFVALLRKKNKSGTGYPTENFSDCPSSDINEAHKNDYDSRIRKRYRDISSEAFDFLEKIGFNINPERLWTANNKLFLLPDIAVDLKGFRVLRSGLLLGEMKTGRFEPAQSLAMALKTDEYPDVLDLKADDIRVIKYLKCESIDPGECGLKDGYCLVAVEGYPLGWGKIDKGRFKNKYLPSWRLQ